MFGYLLSQLVHTASKEKKENNFLACTQNRKFMS